MFTKMSFCYEGCTPNGKHGDLFSYKNLLESLHPYTELALNGNDLDHPEIDKFLEFIKSKKIFANLTINKSQFISNYDRLKYWSDNKFVYGIGVSLQKVTDDFIQKLNSIPNTVLHTINDILSAHDICLLRGKNIKLLILGYKNLQR